MKNTTKLLNLLTTFLAVIGICAASLVCFIVAYTQINGGFSPKYSADYGTAIAKTDNSINTISLDTDSNDNFVPKSLSDTDTLNDYNTTESISLAADQMSTKAHEYPTYEYDTNTAFPENDYIINTEANNTSDSTLYAMPIEQEISSTSFITDGSAQTSNIYSSSGNNFNTYNNPEQQQTTDSYVLNTNPERMKIHYPNCYDVVKIAQENYSTSNLSINELQAQGYTTCGHCFR